ncbi:MAG: 3-hydroxyacyl-CoA dehydrogenase family protein [Synergistaceae bacterium]|jgi:3-hydroxybutyryl-CoA dehydrogenase|nr:3-hydroxyacyl-CoA dehydrogenase family protein [Synergistaceae bacterium]
MRLEDIKKVCVIGAGLMGRQIALNTALYGYEVTLTDSIPEALENASSWKDDYLAGRLQKGRLTRQKVEDVASRLRLESDPAVAVRGANLVIEAIVEDRAAKEELLSRISSLVSEDALIATNSSYMVSSLFAGCVTNPARLANFHYFNPALVMKLVEVVQGPHTSEETVRLLMEFATSTGKSPVWVRQEIDGFLANRILRAVNFEAFSLLEKGIASFQDIDIAVENGLGYPMGPFRLQDLTGIDLAYHTAMRILNDTGVKRPGFDIIRQKYEAGEWGRKSGKGFYEYPKE